MSETRTHRSRKCRGRPRNGALPDDLYAYAEARPSPPISRHVKHDLAGWTVTDDLPDPLPVTEVEVDVFEAWFGDLFDELFGPCR